MVCLVLLGMVTGRQLYLLLWLPLVLLLLLLLLCCACVQVTLGHPGTSQGVSNCA
jgi:hypothetical protein